MKKQIDIFFIIAVFALIIAPFVCMPFFQNQTNSEKRDLSPLPSLMDDDKTFNVDFLSDFGDYFEDHFAFRNELIATNNAVNRSLLTSGSDSIVVGNDGWLFYSGTLNDYERKNQLSERALQNIAHNLSFVQKYCENRGSDFTFVCPPNKNELYSGKMPYYIVKGEGENNWERLKPYLDEYGVRYVDAYAILKDSDETLYMKTDSHWNTKGAIACANAILANSKIGVPSSELVTNCNLTGDLERLINPLNPSAEMDSYVKNVNDEEGFKGLTWSFSSGNSVEDSTVTTKSNDANAIGNLVMYRDSFGNALMPFMATAFEKATFSKLVPYNMLLVDDKAPSLVVVERAQRHLNYLAEVAPIMQSVKVDESIASTETKNLDVKLQSSNNGPFTILQGTLPQAYQKENTKCYLTLKNKNGDATTFEAYNTSQNLPDTFADMENGTESQTVLNNGEQTDFGFAFYIDSKAFDVENCEFTISVNVDGKVSDIKAFEYNNIK